MSALLKLLGNAKTIQFLAAPTGPSIPTTAAVTHFLAAGSVIMALQQSSSVIYVSTDNGATYVQGSSLPGNLQFAAVISGTFYAFSVNGGTSYCSTTTNGSTWNNFTMSGDTTLAVTGTDLIYNGTDWVGLGFINDGTGRRWYSYSNSLSSWSGFGLGTNNTQIWEIERVGGVYVGRTNTGFENLGSDCLGGSSPYTPPGSMFGAGANIWQQTMFVRDGALYAMTSTHIVRTVDGVNWTSYAHNLSSPESGGNLSFMAYGPYDVAMFGGTDSGSSTLWAAPAGTGQFFAANSGTGINRKMVVQGRVLHRMSKAFTQQRWGRFFL